jgi:hypothetical protein
LSAGEVAQTVAQDQRIRVNLPDIQWFFWCSSPQERPHNAKPIVPDSPRKEATMMSASSVADAVIDADGGRAHV